MLEPLYDIPLTLIDGTETDFGRYRGKTVLVVNVASECGFTGQYAGLEALYRRYRDRGLEILGVPCNQFLGQEPGTEEQIQEFCARTYAVTFQLTRKADVRGRRRHPLYAELVKFKTGVLPGAVKWNFEKFLVGPDGQVKARFAPTVDPEAPQVVRAIEALLIP